MNKSMRDVVLPAVAFVTEIQWRPTFSNLEVHEILVLTYDNERKAFACDWKSHDGSDPSWIVDASFVFAQRMEALLYVERVVASKMGAKWTSKDGPTLIQTEALTRFRQELSARERLEIQMRLKAPRKRSRVTASP